MKIFLSKLKVVSDCTIILFRQVSGEYSSFLCFYSYVHCLLNYTLLFVTTSVNTKRVLCGLSVHLWLRSLIGRRILSLLFSATKLYFQSSKKCIWCLLTFKLSCHCHRKTVLFLMTRRVATHWSTRLSRSASPLKE